MGVKGHDEELDERALTGAEGELLVASAARSRAADKELAAVLGRAQPSRGATSTGYLDELAHRSALSPAAERALVAAAQAGDATARARLVETFMPLIAVTARVYRDSPAVDRVELLQEGVVGLLRALERSPVAVREFIARADAKALAENRAITAALVRELLAELAPS